MLAKDGNIVYTYGLEKAEELKDKQNIIFCDKLNINSWNYYTRNI